MLKETIRRSARIAAAPLRAIKAFRRVRGGNVAIEFAFVLPILVSLGLGAFDFGNLGLQKITVANAARAGTQYGSQNSSVAADTAGMEQAARNDASDDQNALDVSARQYCVCSDSGAVDCTGLCTGGSDDSIFPIMYVEVTVTNNVPLLFQYTGITSPRPVTSTSTMRVR
jgi:Flp pilus assembly protein TadG